MNKCKEWGQIPQKAKVRADEFKKKINDGELIKKSK